MRRPALTLILAAFGPLAALAAGPGDFPDGATAPAADAVRQHLAGRVFRVALADGSTWRLQYMGNGYLFVDTSTGFKGNGEWRTEQGQVCSQLRGRPGGCNEVRMHEGVLHLKRDSGEIIRLVPN